MPEPVTLSLGQWSMRSILLATALVALSLGIWRSDGTMGVAFAVVAFPSLLSASA
jgi:hypothetical protein